MAGSPGCPICDEVAGRIVAPGGPIYDDGLWLVSHHTGAWTDPAADGPDAHGNPNVLTADRPASGFSQGCAALSCLVEAAPAHDPVAPSAHALPEFAPLRPGADRGSA